MIFSVNSEDLGLGLKRTVSDEPPSQQVSIIWANLISALQDSNSDQITIVSTASNLN